MKLVRGLLLLAVVVAGTGCGGGGERSGAPPAQPPPATTDAPARGPVLGQRCQNDEAGYAISYPDGWFVNEDGIAPPCSFFDPAPVVVPEASEAVGFAVAVDREPVRAGTITGDDPSRIVKRRKTVRVANREAIRLELETTGLGLLPDGVRGVLYAVPLGSETLILSSYDVDGGEFRRHVEVLDAMAQTLTLA